MKKFRFSLEKMLRYQQSLLEEEKNRLGQLRMQKNQIDRRIEENQTQIIQLGDERTQKSAQGISVIEMQSYNCRIDAAIRLMEELTIQQNHAQSQVERQLERVILQQREVSGLERLREKQMEEYQAATQKEQDLIIGEMVCAKYIRGQKEAEAI